MQKCLRKCPQCVKPKTSPHKPNKTKAVTKDMKPKKGTGRKSGVLNRCEVGASDDEIAELILKTLRKQLWHGPKVIGQMMKSSQW